MTVEEETEIYQVDGKQVDYLQNRCRTFPAQHLAGHDQEHSGSPKPLSQVSPHELLINRQEENVPVLRRKLAGAPLTT